MAQYEITLRDYWRILRRRRAVVVLTALALGAASLLLSLLWRPPPEFRAAAKVQINTTQSLTALYLQSASYNTGDPLETQRAIVTSYPVLHQAGERLGLLAGPDTAQVVLDLQRRVTTRQEGYTNIIVIEAKAPDPGAARELANTVARVYQTHDDEIRSQQAVRNRAFVEEQRQKARQSLADAEEAVRRYRQESDLVSLDAQASVMLGQITETDRQVTNLEAGQRDLEAILHEIAAAGTLSERSMQGAQRNQVGETFLALGQQLNQLRLERDGLLVQFTADHPQVQQVQAKVDQLVRSMTEELRQRRLALEREAQTARDRLVQLRGDYNQLPTRGLQLARLQREVDLHQGVVTALEEEYQRALIREADRAEGVTVLQWAVTPTEPVNPSEPLKRTGVGLVLGLIVGVVFAVLAEILDTSIGTIEDVQEYTGAQVVGLIPFFRLEEVANSLRRRGGGDLSDRALQRKAQLVAYFDPQSTLAEAYRTLRTNVDFVTVERGARTLMVSSAASQEGKSTVSANLAMTTAQLGKRVLLVDCDLRKPSLARLFGLDREPGLAEVIVGNCSWSSVVRTVTDIVTGGMGLEDVMQTQGIGNLHILTSGAVPPNPAELLNSRSMDQFLSDVGAAYDLVLLDAPPLLQVTDALILGKKTGGALLVYRAGDVPRTSLRRAANLLGSVQVPLLGVVLNGVRSELSGDYHDFGYSSYYGYGVEPDDRRAAGWWTRWTAGRDQRQRRRAGRGRSAAPRDPDSALAPPAPGRRSAPAVARRWPGRVATASLLALVVAGLAWQSGYLPWAAPALLWPGGSRVDPGSPLPPVADVRAARPGLPPESSAPASVLTGREGAHPDSVAVPDTASRAPVPAPAGSAESAVPALAAPALAWRGAARPVSIQLAAYAPGSARGDQLLQRLRQQGEPAFVSLGGTLRRPLALLLIGAFATRAEASARATRLGRAAGAAGAMVVQLPWAVELAVAGDSSAAQAALLQVGDNGRFALLQADGAGTWRVVAGAFATPAEARRFAAANHLGGHDPPVVRR
jgi:capsular exopolysaccharide synthesis family protein